MANHKVYSAIVLAVNNGQLKEPFGQDDFRRTCPNLGEGTTKHFYINKEKEIQAEHQNYLKWSHLESFVYYVLFGMIYDNSIMVGVAEGFAARYGGGVVRAG